MGLDDFFLTFYVFCVALPVSSLASIAASSPKLFEGASRSFRFFFRLLHRCPKTGYHKFQTFGIFPFAVLNFNLIKKRFECSRFHFQNEIEKADERKAKNENEIIIL